MAGRHSLSAFVVALGLTSFACDGDGDSGRDPLDAGAEPQDDAGAGDAGEPDGGELDDPLGRAGQWDPRFTIAGFSGQDGLAPRVYDFASLDGEVLAAGYFSWLGSERIDPLARLGAQGWASFGEGVAAPPGGLSAVAVGPAGEVAMAEYSGPFGGTRAYSLWLKDAAGAREIGTFEGTIRALAFFGGRLWAAGFFGMEGGIESLAVWDGESWAAPPGGPVDGPVYALSVEASELLVGGGFTQVGGIAASAVASYDGADWTAFDLENARVFAVAREAGELYAAGVGVGGVVHHTGSAWESLGGGLHQLEQDGQGVVSDIVFHQGDLYAIGCFGGAGGESAESPRVAVDSIARFTGTRWEALSELAPIASSFFQFGVCGSEPNEFTLWDMSLQRLFSDGERVFVGGAFPGLGSTPSQSIVVYDGSDYVAQGEPGDGLMGSAATIVVGGPDARPHLFGGITHAGETSGASGVYRLDEGGWTALGGELPDGLSCFVTAGGHNVAVTPDGGVFIGCTREDPEGPPPCTDCPPVFPVILSLVDGAFEELPAIGQPGAADDLAVDGLGRLWAVGGVRTGDATGTGWVARWDEDHFTVVEDGFNSMVFRIAFAPGGDGGTPVVGGAFTQLDGAPRARIARWQDGGFAPLGSALTTAVLALAAAHDGTLYAATSAESASYFVLARWDGSAWTDIATPANGLAAPAGEAVHQVNSLAVVGPRLLVGGSLLPAYDASTPFPEVERALFVFDGARFRAFGGGVKASSVDSMAVGPDGVWFVGALLAEAGSGATLTSSVGVAHWVWSPAP